jgi:hypothetical protein
MLSFDSRSIARIYQMSLCDGVWKLWHDAPGFSQRFEGAYSDDWMTISGRWEKSADGVQWELDFDSIPAFASFCGTCCYNSAGVAASQPTACG